ncbi:MAG: glycosyltransferase family 2 protein [Clostridiales bacterium]|jgi:glycosyltransferase involved in cell wall biosynthesis|nr:glycosyltransferase family 2 protein [Clostridiales bacterium]
MSIAVIIPAYNEENSIGYVLDAVSQVKQTYDILTDIVVVSDGSTDRTAEIAWSYGVRVIELPQNMGKSHAMKAGLDNTTAPIILFLDADLIGLKTGHILNLVAPVYNDLADMTLGIFYAGRGMTALAQRLAPFLTGQRTVKRWILESLNHEDWSAGYGIEVALSYYARKYKLRVVEVPLYNVTHIIKEEKLGLTRGMAARMKMYWEIARKLNRP